MAEICVEGVCVDEMGGALFYEEFANDDAGWTLETEWQIGSAAAGCGDPGTDHTPTDNNGVAGSCSAAARRPSYTATTA